MANYTQHYHLHQWEPEDSFLRTDFNGDLSAIDAALLGLEAGQMPRSHPGGTQGMGSWATRYRWAQDPSWL